MQWSLPFHRQIRHTSRSAKTDNGKPPGHTLFVQSGRSPHRYVIPPKWDVFRNFPSSPFQRSAFWLATSNSVQPLNTQIIDRHKSSQSETTRKQISSVTSLFATAIYNIRQASHQLGGPSQYEQCIWPITPWEQVILWKILSSISFFCKLQHIPVASVFPLWWGRVLPWQVFVFIFLKLLWFQKWWSLPCLQNATLVFICFSHGYVGRSVTTFSWISISDKHLFNPGLSLNDLPIIQRGSHCHGCFLANYSIYQSRVGATSIYRF